MALAGKKGEFHAMMLLQMSPHTQRQERKHLNLSSWTARCRPNFHQEHSSTSNRQCDPGRPGETRFPYLLQPPSLKEVAGQPRKKNKSVEGVSRPNLLILNQESLITLIEGV